jgi:AcrR family transcriptional regulator
MPAGAEARPGQRDRQKAATREALRSAAMRLFAERGFRDTTTDDIAAAVGVTRRTFFLHFTSKDEVLLGHIAHQLDLLVLELDAAPAHLDPAARAWHAVARLADSMEQRGDLLLQLDLLAQAPELLAVNLQKMTGFEGAITAAVQRWRGPADAGATVDGAGSAAVHPADEDGYALLVGSVTIAALRTALAMWQRQNGRGPISALFLAQVNRLRSGLV